METKAGGGRGPLAFQRDLGSAFCIHPSGLFLTNEHVIHPLGEVTLVLNPGDKKTEKTYAARVIRADKQLDLALLRIEGAKDLAALSLGSDEKLEELTEVVAFGFPFGTDPPAPSLRADLRRRAAAITRRSASTPGTLRRCATRTARWTASSSTRRSTPAIPADPYSTRTASSWAWSRPSWWLNAWAEPGSMKPFQ